MAVLGVLVFAVALAASALARTPTPLPAPEPTSAPFHTAIPQAAPPEATPRVGHTAGRFIVPIEGASLPADPDDYPEAPRTYRAGFHEGVDFSAARGTPVRAAADGVIARIDREFTDWTTEEREAALEAARAIGYTPEATLDRIRGRQVWIDHGEGIVTRYAHLESVAALSVGTRVVSGMIVGAVGSSGYPEGGPHLHFEVRVGDGYLGEGLAAGAVLRVVARAFVD